MKIAILAFYSVGIFFADTWAGLATYLVLAVILCAILKPPVAKMLKLGIVVYVIAGLTLLFNAFLITSNGIVFTQEGFIRGAFFAVRIILLVMASLIVCMSTDPISVSSAIRSYLSPLACIKVPVDDISTILSIAIRFIPLTASEYFAIKDAQWSRGASFDEGPVFGRIKAHCAILIPLFVNMFRKADSLAMAMDSRGYGISGIKRVDINSSNLDVPSMLIGILVCSICVATSVFL